MRPTRRISRRIARALGPAQGVKLLKAAARAARAAQPKAPRSRAERPTGRFVEADGLRVHTIRKGRGRPVVLLHGNGTLAEEWVISGLADKLAERYRVIAPDRPGFGHTDRPRDRVWTPSAQAWLVHRVLEELGAENPVVVGHSWGTLVALALGINRYRALRGLVLLSGYYYPTARADVAASAPLAVPVLGDALRQAAPPVLSRVLGEAFIQKVFLPRPVPARFRANFPFDLAARPEQQRAIAEDAAILSTVAAALRPHYPALRLPVAILTGAQDQIVSAHEQSSRLHADVPGSTLAVLPGVGHMIHYAAPAKIVRAVDQIMDLKPGRGSALR